jgi:hypothetical protein
MAMSSGFPAHHDPPPQNGVGMTGFILSMCGLVCMGLFPIGMIVSLFGLQKEPKGFAVAGTIIGAVGTVAMVLVVVIYGTIVFTMFAACVGFGTALQTQVDTQRAIEAASNRIENNRDNDDQLPSQAEGDKLIAGLKDGWKKQVRYERDEANDDYLIRSAGPDGKFDTVDDKTSDDYSFSRDDDSTQKSMSSKGVDDGKTESTLGNRRNNPRVPAEDTNGRGNRGRSGNANRP